MCVALVGLCTSAQEKGDMAVGLNLGVAPCLESGSSLTNFGFGAKFQYNVTNPIRLEADVDYWFKDKGCDIFDVSANAHYLIGISDKFTVYPLVGIGYACVGGSFGNDVDFGDFDDWADYSNDTDDLEVEDSASLNRFLFNVGIGAEYALTDKLSIGAEIKYQYIKDFNRLPISIGVTYKF